MEEATMEATLGYYASYFTEREFKIAEIMVELPDIISELDYRPRVRVPWGHKKKRSALAVQDQSVGNKSTVLRLRLASSSSSPNPEAKIPAANAVKVETASPNTPLSFESDDKPNHLTSKLLLGKRKREEWLEMIAGLDKRKELLQKEIQNVKDYKEKLIKFNLELQSRKQELINQSLIKKEPQLKIEEQNLNLEMQLGQPTPTPIIICAPSIVKQDHYHQQTAPHQYQMHIMADQTAQTRSAVISENYGYLSSNTQVASTCLPSNSVSAAGFRLLTCNNNGGQILVPDLLGSSLANQNLYKAMAAAQARQQRRQICRGKNPSSLLKDRFKSSSHAKRGHDDDSAVFPQ